MSVIRSWKGRLGMVILCGSLLSPTLLGGALASGWSESGEGARVGESCIAAQGGRKAMCARVTLEVLDTTDPQNGVLDCSHLESPHVVYCIFTYRAVFEAVGPGAGTIVGRIETAGPCEVDASWAGLYVRRECVSRDSIGISPGVCWGLSVGAEVTVTFAPGVSRTANAGGQFPIVCHF